MKQTELNEYVREHQVTVEDSFAKLAIRLGEVAHLLVEALESGHKVLAFGNGGSAAEASHLVAELIGRFAKAPRRPLPAISLASDASVTSCIGNDFGYALLFARQIEALANPGDIAIAFTTSGQSENVLRGIAMARRKGAATIALTGRAGLGGAPVDYLLDVASDRTSLIQEVHLMMLHVLCASVDRAFAVAEKEEEPNAGS